VREIAPVTATKSIKAKNFARDINLIRTDRGHGGESKGIPPGR
jgi:hypothetical protein